MRSLSRRLRCLSALTGALILTAACNDIPLPPLKADGLSTPDLGQVLELGQHPDTNTNLNDEDGDGFNKSVDCDDNDKTVFPGANEVPYDGVDQNCDGSDLTDVDKDGYDSNKVSGGTDCDDDNASAHPGGVEICGDSIDQDCDGQDQSCDDKDKDGDGYSSKAGDCNDDDKSVNPGATETPYNGKDDDCDSSTPDDDLDGDGFNKVGGKDCDDKDKTVYPGAKETPYDGKDQDCDGKDLTDADGDGYDSDTLTGGTDCDDTDKKVNPGATEVPYDTVDQDCDGKDVVTKGVFTVATLPSYYSPWPRIAYNGSGHMVVWYDYVSSNYVIRAQRLTKTGSKEGSMITIKSAKSPLYAYEPDVASDGSGYMVVWRLQDSTASPTKYSLIGQRLTASGAKTGAEIVVRAAANGYYKYRPRIVYGDGKFAVAWRERTTSASPYYYYPYVQLITASTGVLSGSALKLSTVNSYYPSVAYGNKSFLVAWYYTNQVFGRTVNSATGALGTKYTITKQTGSVYYPEAAFDGTNYLTAWYDYRNYTASKYDLYGQLVSKSGSLVGTSSPANFAISKAPQDQRYPTVVYCGGRYNVLFRDGRYLAYQTLYRQPVGTDGKLKDATETKNLLLYAEKASVNYLHAVCDGANIMAVWLEYDSAGKYSIKGMVIKP